jgi:hypothetical protein
MKKGNLPLKKSAVESFLQLSFLFANKSKTAPTALKKIYVHCSSCIVILATEIKTVFNYA